MMRHKIGILFFGLTELTLGTTTLCSIFFEIARRGASSKPVNVLTFVVASSAISAALGAGVILRQRYARKLLIFFAGWVILSKLLIAMGILTLCCALETTVSPNVKNAVSIVYHAAVMLYFHHPLIKAEFEA